SAAAESVRFEEAIRGHLSWSQVGITRRAPARRLARSPSALVAVPGRAALMSEGSDTPRPSRGLITPVVIVVAPNVERMAVDALVKSVYPGLTGCSRRAGAGRGGAADSRGCRYGCCATTCDSSTSSRSEERRVGKECRARGDARA